ncbi:HDOD domain-containing protein [Ruminococcaceae bacterium OttesenSCG-928-I18]|nr:HDOD domain-containing protein [Ruminococcaceae bacterium OttesenSCG-928-I18]
MNAYFARQPILDTNQKLHGYELLFRPDPQASTSGDMPSRDGDAATASVLEAISSKGIETVTGGKRAFVNFTERLLLDGVATFYPKEYLTVEVLESIETTSDVLDALTDLKQKGYTVALDDYVYHSSNKRLLELADIVKVEAYDDSALENIRVVASHIHSRHCQLLAEKVETEEMYQQVKALGCTLFQGFFFAKPALMLEHTVGSLRINHLRLIREATRPNVDFALIADIIKQDPGLSYKLLRLVNSAYFGIRNEVKNIRQAVVYLGALELKKWISFVTLTGLCVNKPSELVLMSLIRAHFCEQVAMISGHRRDSEAFFLAGMFSLLDAMIDADMETALSKMSVPQITREALLEGGTPAATAIALITKLENGEWDDVTGCCEKLNIDPSQVSEIYYNALHWANAFTDDLMI